MDFSYAKELEIIAHAANAFAKQYILAHRQEWDKSQTFPIDSRGLREGTPVSGKPSFQRPMEALAWATMSISPLSMRFLK